MTDMSRNVPSPDDAKFLREHEFGIQDAALAVAALDLLKPEYNMLARRVAAEAISAYLKRVTHS